MLVLEQRGVQPPEESASVFVVAMPGTQVAAVTLVRELRREFVVDVDLEARAFGAQMKAAGKSGARLAVILGEDEWARGEVAIKHLGTGEQQTVARAGLAAALREALRGIGSASSAG